MNMIIITTAYVYDRKFRMPKKKALFRPFFGPKIPLPLFPKDDCKENTKTGKVTSGFNIQK
jgi:hypothetical protein